MAAKITKTLLTILLAATFAFTWSAATLFALEEESGLQWEQLRPQEQRTLRFFADQWAKLSAEKRQDLRRGARLWLQLKEPEKTKARNRLEQWEQLGPTQQQDIREGLKRFQQLPPQERNLLLASRHWYMKQSDIKRQQLKEQWDQLPTEEREELLDRLQERWETNRQDSENR